MKRLAVFVLLAGCQPTVEDVALATVERGPLVVTVEVSGTMRAVDSDPVSPPAVTGVWNYKIAMMAPEGAEVKKGEPILAFDTSELQRQLDAKTAERDSAATQVDVKTAAAKVARQDERLAIAEAEAELRKAKVKASAPAHVTPTIDLEKARYDLELAREKIAYLQKKSRAAAQRDDAEISRWRGKRDRAQERVTEMQSAIAQMTVTALRDGTVIYPTDWEGKKKKVGDGAWRAETVLQVVSLAQMEGDGEIDEVDISKVAVDQKVSLRLDAQADVELRGHVREISRTIQRAAPENPLRVAHLDIALDPGAEVRLRPGMRFRGEIEIDRLEDVLLVPLDAVFATPDGPVAYRRTREGFVTLPLQIGAGNQRYVVVTEGLDEGDEIVRADAETEQAS